jgi:hypothetical protein
MKSSTKILISTISATNASQVTAEFDCLGYNFAKIIALGNTTNGAQTNNNLLVESDTSGGTTNSISGYVQGTDWTQNTNAVVANAAKMVWGVPLGGRKRYLKATFTPSGTCQCALVCELSDAYDTALTRAQAAVGSSVGI